jgi:hypothetical protein
MIAKLTIGGVLDYTHVAEPLTIDDISRDIDETAAALFRDVSEIVVWEHQADYMVKLTGTVAIWESCFDNSIGDTGIPGGNGRRITSLFGIPVRYA